MPTDAVLSPPRAVLSATEAHLFVNDIGASCDYFTGKLGFAVDFTYGDPPFYGQVKRDRARLALRKVCEPVFVGDIRERELLLSASIPVDTAAGIRALYGEVQAGGADIFQALKKEPWGALNFIVRDPDGNLVLFAGPAA